MEVVGVLQDTGGSEGNRVLLADHLGGINDLHRDLGRCVIAGDSEAHDRPVDKLEHLPSENVPGVGADAQRNDGVRNDSHVYLLEEAKRPLLERPDFLALMVW